MGVKIILAKKYRDDVVGVLAIQEIKDGRKTQQRIGIKVNQDIYDDYFDKDTDGFNKNDKIDWKKINTEIRNQVNQYLNKELQSFKTTQNNADEQNENLSYIDYINKEIDLILVPSTKQRYKDVLNAVKKYLTVSNKQDLLFKEINIDWIQKFVVYLKNKGLANTSIVDTMSLFRRIVNSAINKNHYSYPKDPFAGYEALPKTSKPKEPLTDADIKKLILLQSDGSKKMDTLIFIKNMFLFQFFANGMRMSDLFFIRWGDFTKEKLSYKMMKTDKNMEVFFNINICHILNEILEQRSLYEEMIDRIEVEIPRNCYRIIFANEPGFRKMNIIRCKKLLEKLDVKRENISNAIKGGDIGRYEHYEGYYLQYAAPLEYKEAVKEIIDLRIALENKIENFYIQKTYGTLKGLDKNEFVFEKFVKDKHKGIFKKYDKTKELTDEQFKKFKNLQSSYNMFLTQLEKTFDFDVHLSSHIARHSFINSLLKSGKADLWDIMNLMGHGELRTSERYINKHFQGKEKQYKINKEISRFYQMRLID